MGDSQFNITGLFPQKCSPKSTILRSVEGPELTLQRTSSGDYSHVTIAEEGKKTVRYTPKRFDGTFGSGSFRQLSDFAREGCWRIGKRSQCFSLTLVGFMQARGLIIQAKREGRSFEDQLSKCSSEDKECIKDAKDGLVNVISRLKGLECAVLDRSERGEEKKIKRATAEAISYYEGALGVRTHNTELYAQDYTLTRPIGDRKSSHDFLEKMFTQLKKQIRSWTAELRHRPENGYAQMQIKGLRYQLFNLDRYIRSAEAREEGSITKQQATRLHSGVAIELERLADALDRALIRD